jgi:hypothetical protein
MQAASNECVNNKLTAIIWPMFASDNVARFVLRADVVLAKLLLLC